MVAKIELITPESTAAWSVRGFPLIKPTHYTWEMMAGRQVLVGRSEDANRSLVRELKVEQPTHAVLRWRWHATGTLQGDPPERTKAGDNYAARVFVIFETSWLPTRTRAINYVWSAREPEGSRFASPYSDHVRLMVLQSDSDRQTPTPVEWRFETRDVLADYAACFGEAPSVINAIAVMVDTDGSDHRATGWFSDMVLEISPAPANAAP